MADETADQRRARKDRERAARNARDAAANAGAAAARVKDTAGKSVAAVRSGAEAVGTAMDSAVGAVGGVKQYHRMLYDFVTTSFLARAKLTDRPSKFLLLLVVISFVQAALPIFASPIDFFARLVSFLFLYETGLLLLRGGLKRGPARVRTLLVALLAQSALDVVPRFAFDAPRHLGALWTLALPLALTATPTEDRDASVAGMLADLTWAPLSDALAGWTPGGLGDQWEGTAVIVGAITALLFWIGYLGPTGSSTLVWAYLALQTALCAGAPAPDASSRAFTPHMAERHNVLAIWLWRLALSAAEGLSVPGVLSVRGLLDYYVPGYDLCITALLVGMLVTKKTERHGRADTWYARVLVDGWGKTVQPTASSSSSSRSSSSRERRSVPDAKGP